VMKARSQRECGWRWLQVEVLEMAAGAASCTACWWGLCRCPARTTTWRGSAGQVCATAHNVRATVTCAEPRTERGAATIDGKFNFCQWAVLFSFLMTSRHSRGAFRRAPLSRKQACTSEIGCSMLCGAHGT
jgi:hypothetical protein